MVQTKTEGATNLSATIADALAGIEGNVLTQASPGYEDARKVWNGMIDKRPAVIVQPATVAGVVAAVNAAREAGLKVTVRGGGHNVSGNALNDGGVVIDLSLMRRVEVDPANRTVRAEGGATIGDVDTAAQEHGLAVPLGVVSETGIAGITMGGGLGWLRRKCGPTSDNLLSVDVVTADGQFITASESENADLFWAVRGGGGGFGAVTSFEYQAHPVGPEVYFTFVFHPYETAADALRFFREFTSSAPEELGLLAFFAEIPPIEMFPAEHHGKRTIAFIAPYVGNAGEGEEVCRPLREFATPYADFSGVTQWVELQKALDEDYPNGRRYYWKSTYLAELSDHAIENIARQGGEFPSPLTTIDIWHLGGAMAHPREDTAFANREAPFLLTYEANWDEPSQDEENVSWARNAWNEAQRFSTGGLYLNFPGFGEGEIERQAFGPNTERIAAIKKRYDPQQLFT
jgi:FAD/FMN-containing dehydrogenase